MLDSIKTQAGRLREAGVRRIHELRAAYDAEGNPRPAAMTLQAIATELGLSLGTVYNVCAGNTHRDLHPGTRSPARTPCSENSMPFDAPFGSE